MSVDLQATDKIQDYLTLCQYYYNTAMLRRGSDPSIRKNLTDMDIDKITTRAEALIQKLENGTI